jgi:mannose-1-phosphate guanylyltransferase / phosphomannomutase
VKAVILAGGFGTRLRPLTTNVPKPMAHVMNTPMLEHIINLLKKHGFTDITMMLYFQPEVITNYFRDGAAFGVKISYITSTKDLGTAGCVTLAKEHLKDESFLIISGDVFTNFDLGEAVKFHSDKKALATIVLTKSTDPLRYGIVITEKDGRVNKILEKPSWGEVFSDTINTGIYVFSPEVFKYIPDDTDFDFSKNLFPALLSGGAGLYGYTGEGYWKDIGTLAEYRQVHYDILGGEIECDIKGERHGKIGKDVWIGKNCEIGKNVKFRDTVVIGDNVKIMDGAEISNSVIGDWCWIDNGAKIVRSIIWDKNSIEKETDIKEAVIGSNNKIRWKTYVGVGAVISENCFIGREVIIKPEVKLWPDKTVEDGSIVSSSLIWQERWSNRLFDIYGITALSNIELTPEVGAKIGAAYASALPKGSSILISRDYHRSSLMIERAIMAGIMSSGVNIFDFRIMPLSVTKYVAKSLKVAGGLHIRKSPYDAKSIDIKFFDAAGMDISLSQEKSIESSFYREEYRRAEDSKIGKITYPPRAVEYYLEGFKEKINTEIIKAKKFKLVIDYSYGTALNIFPSLLGELDCDVIALNAHQSESRLTRTQEKFEEALNNLADTVKTTKADAGVMIDAGGQKVFIVDDSGNILKNDDAVLVMAKLFLKANPGKTVALPVDITKAAEQMIEEEGGRSIRVGTTYRSLMTAANDNKADFVAEEKGGYIFSEFQPAFDGMFATVKMLEYLAGTGGRLSEITASLPKYIKISEDEPVAWDKRGAVMKELVVLSQKAGTDNIEGIEFTEGSGRILIIPDNDRPFFHIYAEAETKEKAASLIKKYREILKETAKER